MNFDNALKLLLVAYGVLERYSEALSHETHVTVRGIAWDRRADSEKGSMLATTALGFVTLATALILAVLIVKILGRMK